MQSSRDHVRREINDKTGKSLLDRCRPGDPGLLSIKAMECLQTADAVVYDRLADPRILAYAKDDAENGLMSVKLLPTIQCVSQISINCW